MAHSIFTNLSYLVAENPGSDSKIPDYLDISLEYFNEEVNFEKKPIMTDNGTKMYLVPLGEEFENDDASWIMSCTFMIFTMQTGLGLVESGMCSMKNEVRIQIKSQFLSYPYGLILNVGQVL